MISNTNFEMRDVAEFLVRDLAMALAAKGSPE